MSDPFRASHPAHHPWVVLPAVSREQIEPMLADPAFREDIDDLLQARRHEASILWRR
jgi:starch phosphorylase